MIGMKRIYYFQIMILSVFMLPLGGCFDSEINRSIYEADAEEMQRENHIVGAKKGKSEKINFTFNNTMSIRTLGRIPEIVKDPYIQASYKKIMGAPWYDLYSEEELEYAKQRSLDPSLPAAMINPRDPNRYTYLGATDWFHEIYNNTGTAHSHSISMSGATKKTSYYLGGEYFSEKGMVKYNTDMYNRYNLRSNVSYQVTDWLNISNNTSMTYYTYTAPASLSF